MTSIGSSNDSHFFCESHFQKKPSRLSIYPDSETDNEIDESKIRNKITDVNKQNPVSNGYHIVSELGDLLQSGFYDSSLGYDNVDWFADGVISLLNKIFLIYKH